MEPENQKLLYKEAGMLPCRSSVLTDMTSSGEVEGGDVVGEEFKHVQALFPQGAPKWYSKFSSAAQGLLNSAVKGDIDGRRRAEAALRQGHGAGRERLLGWAATRRRGSRAASGS